LVARRWQMIRIGRPARSAAMGCVVADDHRFDNKRRGRFWR
jgi:hypothetical protein